MWKPVFTGVCETHGRSVKYNGGWFTGLAGVSEEVRLPAEGSTSAPGIAALLNQLQKVEKIQFVQPVQFKG